MKELHAAAKRLADTAKETYRHCKRGVHTPVGGGGGTKGFIL
jgi:hypothetical protein